MCWQIKSIAFNNHRNFQRAWECMQREVFPGKEGGDLRLDVFQGSWRHWHGLQGIVGPNVCFDKSQEYVVRAFGHWVKNNQLCLGWFVSVFCCCFCLSLSRSKLYIKHPFPLWLSWPGESLFWKADGFFKPGFAMQALAAVHQLGRS